MAIFSRYSLTELSKFISVIEKQIEYREMLGEGESKGTDILEQMLLELKTQRFKLNKKQSKKGTFMDRLLAMVLPWRRKPH